MTGDPSHLELGVPDPSKAITFYSALLGWQATPMGGGGMVETGTLGIGIHGGDEARHFEVFFAVAQLDDAIATLRELGGRTVGEITESPGFGRWIECADDQNVRFGLREVAA